MGRGHEPEHRMSKVDAQISVGGSRLLGHAQGSGSAPARGRADADAISAHGERHPGPLLNVLRENDTPHPRVEFLSVVARYPQEMALKLHEGADALIDLLSDNDIGDVIEPDRQNPAREHLSGISA